MSKNNMRRQSAQDVKNERYYKLHHFLFEAPFMDLSDGAKIMYALLSDRRKLSLENEWIDDNGDVYFIYANPELAQILKKSVTTVIKYKKELMQAGLIDEVRRGFNLTNIFYLTVPALEPQGITETEIQELQKLKFRNYRKLKSRVTESVDDLELHYSDLHEARSKVSKQVSMDNKKRVPLESFDSIIENVLPIEHYPMSQSSLRLWIKKLAAMKHKLINEDLKEELFQLGVLGGWNDMRMSEIVDRARKGGYYQFAPLPAAK